MVDLSYDSERPCYDIAVTGSHCHCHQHQKTNVKLRYYLSLSIIHQLTGLFCQISCHPVPGSCLSSYVPSSNKLVLQGKACFSAQVRQFPPDRVAESPVQAKQQNCKLLNNIRGKQGNANQQIKSGIVSSYECTSKHVRGKICMRIQTHHLPDKPVENMTQLPECPGT